jgi:hypothetical protein
VPQNCKRSVALAVVACVLTPAGVHAAPFDLDPGFGTGGRLVTGRAVPTSATSVDGAPLIVLRTRGSGGRLVRLLPDSLPMASLRPR